MSEQLHKNLFNETDCLSEETLFGYIDNKLSDSDRYLVEKHLIDCELCTDALEGLKLVTHRTIIAETRKQVNETFSGIRKKERKVIWFDFNYKLAAAAAIALFIGSAFILNHFLNKSENVEVYNTAPNTGAIEKQPAPSEPLNESQKEVLTTETPSENINTKTAKKQAERKSPAVSFGNASIEQQQSEYDQTSISKKETDSEHLISDNPAAPSGSNLEPGTATVSPNSATSPITTPEQEPKAKLREQSGTGSSIGGTSKKAGDHFKDEDRFANNEKKAMEKVNVLTTDIAKEETRRSALAKPETKSKKTSLEPKPESYEMQSTQSIDSSLDEPPQFPGGETEQQKFIAGKMNLKNCPNCYGSVFVTFIVSLEGELQDPKIINGVHGCECLSDEALRIVKAMPKWQAGKKNGKAVNADFNLSIKF